jgi:hypothetical protein
VRQPALEVLYDPAGQRGSPAIQAHQRGQVVVFQRLLQQHLQHRRHQRAGVYPVLLSQAQPAGRVEPAHQDGDARLRRVHAHHAHHQSVNVRERQWKQSRPHGRVVGGRGRRPSGSGQRVVTDHHALGPPRRTAGVQQCRERGGVAVDQIGRGRGLQFCEIEQRGVAFLAGILKSGYDDTTDARYARGRCENLGQEFRRRHRQHGAAIGHDVPQFVFAEQEKHGRRDRAGAPHSVVGDADFSAVSHADDDPVARLDAGGAQAAGEPPGALGQLGAGPAAVLEMKLRLATVPGPRILGEPLEAGSGRLGGQLRVCGRLSNRGHLAPFFRGDP